MSVGSFRPTRSKRALLWSQSLHGAEIRELWKEIRNIWLSCSLSEISLENSKMIAVDSRLPLHIVIRSLIEYKKPFVVVYSDDLGFITGKFEILCLIDFLIHYWYYCTDPSYVCRLCSVLSCFINDFTQRKSPEASSDCQPFSTPQLDLTQQQTQSSPEFEDSYENKKSSNKAEREDQLKGLDLPHYQDLVSSMISVHNHNLALSTFPPWFSVHLFEQSTMDLNQFYELYQLMTQRPDIISESESAGLERLKVLISSSTHHEHSPACVKSALYPLAPPWIYSLDFWKRLCGPQHYSAFISIQPDRPTMEAALMMLQKQINHIAIWNDDRNCPIHFLTTYSLLNHIVQHLRGKHLALNLYIIEDLDLGVRGQGIITVTPEAEFLEVLKLFRDHRWTSIPVVHPETQSFLSFFSQSQLMVLVAKLLQNHSHLLGFGQDKFTQAQTKAPSFAMHQKEPLSISDGPSPNLNLAEKFENVAQQFLGYSLYDPQPVNQDTFESFYGPTFNNKAYDNSTTENPDVSKLVDAEAIETPISFLRKKHGIHARISTHSDSAISSPGILNDDITLRVAVSYILTTHEHRIVLLDPQTRRINRIISISDLLAFLIGFTASDQDTKLCCCSQNFKL